MKTKSFYQFSVPAALVVSALALSGCSSESSGKKTEAEESPLQKYMSELWESEQDFEERLAKQQLKTEELIASCMAKEGFEYTPKA